MTAPSGLPYRVRITRHWPIAKSPLGPLDSFAPPQVPFGALLAANAVTRGRTGWSGEVLSSPTARRSERVLHTRRSHDPQRIVDMAVTIVEANTSGCDPSELDDDLTATDRLKRLFDRE